MENSFLKHIKNDIYLSLDDIKILEKYEIDYQMFLNMKELMFEIEEVLNSNYVDSDLEDLSIKLSEYNQPDITIQAGKDSAPSSSTHTHFLTNSSCFQGAIFF